ncbi:2-hydroxy-3-oxopropionate reductase [Brevibacillus ruminantium]|uniref:2-hydroxy-3-oxopropionate reductase n=1 Tax=Brevibacillus ruminantium TaxID=2950604 RepID=A0ABY4WMK7_9BACL|nr:2-hydroxy-3-oxopropionate reductase [Brevibacillus ruminantium]USG66619.1 2-hydroxy-3-oxopropionate reductase [Brevibacillus ruminantium]
MKVGFIGLGIMGKPMAHNLLRKGFDLTVYDINEQAVQELVGHGASSAATPREVANVSAIIVTMLPNNEIVNQVIMGEDGIIHGAKAGSIVIDMSSISPVVSKQLAAALKEHGIHMLDAPVSGGAPKAIDGTLAIMAGGDEEVFQQALPVLTTMGKEVTWVGEHGCGTMTKLANQIIVNVNIAAMSEALVLAAKAGLDIEKMYQAIRSGLAGSAVLDAKVPMILERNFQGGGRIDINLKDLTNVKETAEAIEVPIPLTRQVLEMFQSLTADGKQTDDHCGIVQYYEKFANVTVEKQNP